MKTSASELDPVEELAEAFLQRYRRGERPAVSEYTDKYPELADKIRDLFPALVMMEELGSVANQPTGPDIGRQAEIAKIPQQLGEYRILRQVGRGGMGVVYEAVQESLGRHVALKALPYHRLTNPQLVERFHREARAAARLHHTNIVPVFGVGEHEGIQYYAMQFIQGHSLDVVLQEIRRLRSGKARSSISSSPSKGDSGEGREELTVSLAHGLLKGEFQTREAPTIEGREPKMVESSSTAEKDQTSDVHSQVAFLDARLTMKDGSSDLTSVSRGDYYHRVAQVGLQVAEGLSYAHSQDVLHRDIKPSNLMLDTRGTVWITDFGLAKSEGSDELTQPGDIVGTMRYMAPERFEGRADARSDVYSLGMTLYELLTLHSAFEDSNRARLIKRIAQEQPTWPRRLDPHTPRDLETIVLKAISKEPADRYQTAAEFAEDLKRFLADRPIRARRSSLTERSWRWCRRNPVVSGLIASVTLLLTTIAVGSSVAAFWLNQERNATQKQLDLKEKAEAKGTLRLFDSLVNQARASRWSGRVGQRFQSLEALRQAAELFPALHLEPKALLELRNDAIACMVLPDVRLVKSWEGNPHAGTMGITFDADLESYARTDDKGNISIRRVADDQEIMNLPGPGEPAWGLLFSPDGQYLGAKYHHGNSPYLNQFWVWDVNRRERVFQASSPITTWVFSPGSRGLAVSFLDGTLKVYDLTSPSPSKESIALPPGPPPGWFAFHPDGQKVAVARNRDILLWDFRTGKMDRMFTLTGSVGVVAWHAERKLLATADGQNDAIQVWNTSTGQLQSELKGHQAQVWGVAFDPAGDVLVSYGHDGTIRLWDPRTGHQLLSNSQGQTQFSRDGLRLAGSLGGSSLCLWELAQGRECRKLSTFSPEGRGPWTVDFNDDGRLLVSSNDDGVHLWDLTAFREAAVLNTGGSQLALFGRIGKRLFTTGMKGGQLWKITPNNRDSQEILEIGPAAVLAEAASCGASWSADGRILAIADRAHSKAIVIDMESNPHRKSLDYGHPYIINAVVSPDGHWVASATWGDTLGTVKVYDIRNQKQVREFRHPNASASIAFSPDSKWLVIGAGKAYRFWEVGSWKAGLVVERIRAAGLPLPLAFSADGKILAIVPDSLSAEPVRLIDPSTGQQFATLALPYPERVRWLCFSPDGSQLAACCSGHGIRVWDLRLIRQQLVDMGLDWELPPYPPAESPSAKPLQVKVVQGNLAEQQKTHDPLPPTSLKDQLALYSLAIAIAPVPFHPEFYQQRGYVHERLRQSRQAVEDFSAALLRQPANPKLQAGLLAARGRNHRRLKNYEQTIADLEEALKFDPEQPGVCNDLAWFYVTCPEKLRNLNRALTLAKKANALRPNHWFFLNTLGVTYYRLGKYSEAVEKLESSLRDSQAQAGAFDLFFLSMCHARLGDSAKARDCYDRAVKWIGEHQGQLSPEWSEELRNFRAEADAVLAKPALPNRINSDKTSQR
jgi:serine/threonine protein kinase/WD40 repeat protein/tetratricopeptide (TPR) repeat protein